MMKCKGQKCSKPDRCRCRMNIHVPLVWVLGGPGSGKGTQCDKIVEKYNFIHLSTGDLLREEVASHSEIGRNIDDLMKEGKLVPNDIVLQLLEIAMKKSIGKSSGYLIDGYPREKVQGMEFEKFISPVDLILYFECTNETLIKRVLARAAQSSEVRSDDNESSVKTRIEIFRSNIEGILQQYTNVTKLNGERDIEEIFKEVCEIIDHVLEKKDNSK